MELLTWIDKNLYEIKHTLLYSKYFDSIQLNDVGGIYYLLNPQLGLDITFTELFHVKSIHFYLGSEKGIGQFEERLPLDLDFSFSRDHSRMLLGDPMQSGGGGFNIIYGEAPFWDKYRYDSFYLHLQFSKEKQSINLITIDSLNG